MNEESVNQGVSLVRAVMRSASSDVIPRMEWWSRAKTALEVGATCAHDFAEMVSIMGGKLQIDAFTSSTAETVKQLSVELAESFEEFRRFCEANALYVVAIAQAERDLEKKEIK